MIELDNTMLLFIGSESYSSKKENLSAPRETSDVEPP